MNAGYEEALLLSAQGYVSECTGENIFIIKGQKLLTPPPYVGILKGITRQSVIDLAPRLGLRATDEVLTRHDVYNADEVFLTGTAAEIVPIVKFDGRPIGNAKPGPLTGRLSKEFKKLTLTDGTRYKL